MRTYWELERSERGDLTHDEMTELCNVELMRTGFLRPKLPAPVSKQKPTMKTFDVFVIEFDGSYGKEFSDVCFASREEAERALSGASHLQREYRGDWWVRPFRNGKVVSKIVVTESDRTACKSLIDEWETDVARHEKEMREYDERVRACDKALKGVWEDYRACVAHKQRLEEVRRVYADYLKMTHDDVPMARAFLAKVATSDEIVEAIGEMPAEPAQTANR